MFSGRFAQTAQRVAQRMRHKSLVGLAKSSSLKVLYFVNFVCVAHLFAENVGWVYATSGPSMLPTMSATGELVLENRMISPERLQRGDLITFVSPLTPGRVVCKRIIGLPGDIICVDPTGQLAPSTEHVVIPKHHVWVSGDNASLSRDSRMYGPVSMALIKGKLVAKVYPFRDFTIFRNNFNYID
ncbi:peptidase S24/S26A/S26B/S26C [Amylocystis lapponica]|nr:peptidase S24/S26A/S26B/S26C [Amylocystis lapponica]